EAAGTPINNGNYRRNQMKLAPFSFFLTESNAYNQAYGSAYEMGTVLRLHEKTGSSKNNNPEYKAKIAKMQEEHKNLLGQLPPHLAFRAASASSDSADAYLKSLKERRGINPQDVHEVHHTHGGISDFVGRKVDRASNPHDLVIKGRTKTGGNFTHGASLKATSGTASNNPVGAFAAAGESHGIDLNTHHIWAEGRIENLTKKLQGDRAERMKNKYKENASIISLVQLFQDEEERKNMVKIAEMQKKMVSEEANRLESMGEWKCRVLGISKEDVI
ncbi:MAG: hypothetical protein EB003_13045, partial [Flavobacteriia bacterium]|nr:hypothetical protein [Flavobacteriia bacterium]